MIVIKITYASSQMGKTDLFPKQEGSFFYGKKIICYKYSASLRQFPSLGGWPDIIKMYVGKACIQIFKIIYMQA